jgi:large subunit ribosomal protein L13
MILVNADNKVLGRIATFVAKKALQGEEIVIVNAEKAIITGSKKDAVRKYRSKMDIRGKGNPEKGPKFSRMPDRVVRRAVRGMLPWKSSRGREAYRKVHAYIGIPEEFEGKAFEEMPETKAKRFVEIGEVCKLLGAKW